MRLGLLRRDGRMGDAASRSDCVMVAWQFIARNRVINGYVPLGYGVILYRVLPFGWRRE